VRERERERERGERACAIDAKRHSLCCVSVTMEQVTGPFKAYMTGPERGASLLSAEQHCRQLKAIAVSVMEAGAAGGMLQGLLDTTRVRDLWLGPAKLVFRPGTVLSYLGSLWAFLDYISQAYDLPSDAELCLRRLRDGIVRWRRPLGRDRRLRRAEVYAQTLRDLPTRKQIRRAFASRAVRRLETTLAVWAGRTDIDDIAQAAPAYVYAQCRNYLLLRLACCNAQRNSCLSNMSLADVRHANHGECGIVTIAVARHKTAASHGPAYVCLYPQHFVQLRGLLAMTESLVAAALGGAQAVFCTDQGLPLRPNQIDHGVKAAWRVAGRHGPISLTLIRKAATTFVRESRPELRDFVANHMSHSVRTSDQFYRMITEPASNAAGVMDAIAGCMGAAPRPSQAVSRVIHFGINFIISYIIRHVSRARTNFGRHTHNTIIPGQRCVISNTVLMHIRL
jgi:hypothetical protein